MPIKSDSYNIRVQVCQKCYEHYNHSGLVHSKSYHKARRASNQHIENTPDFIEEEQMHRQHYDMLVDYIEQLQTYLEQNQQKQKEGLSYTLMYSPHKSQSSPRKVTSSVPSFNIIKNKPYKYLSKLPDTKLSTKRYLNTSTKKIVEFPRRDSFQVYFQNLLVFSKLNLQKWPNIRLVSKIIKSLVEYCIEQGPLMPNLKQFINEYMDIKPLETSNISLYEYLILISNFQISQLQTEQNEDKLIQTLQMIIDGRLKVLNISENQLLRGNEQEQTHVKKDIMPYSLVDHKIKTSTIQGIYLGTDNRISKSLKRQKIQHNKSSIRLNLPKSDNKELLCTAPAFKGKPYANSHSSTTSGFFRKSPSFTAGMKNTHRNEVFAMIKMGDMEENLFQQETKCHTSQNIDKSLNKQLKKLCSIDTTKSNIKSQSKITKRAKLFVNTHFNLIKASYKSPSDDSIIWKKYQKPNKNRNSKRSSKNTQINEMQEIENEKENHGTSSHRNSTGQQLKIAPSKKIKRASLFFNQRNSNILSEELKKLTAKNKANSDDNQNTQTQARNSRRSHNPSRNSSNSRRSKTYKEDNSSPSDSDDHSVYSRGSMDDMDEEKKKEYKLKVLQHHIAKKRSRESSQMSKKEQIEQNVESKKQQENEDEHKQKQNEQDPKIEENSLQVMRSPTKLSVKSRRKSSFYYSTAKNNSLLEMINSSQTYTANQDEEKKRDRKRSTRKMSHVNLAQEIRQFHNGVLPVPKIEQGIQCNIEEDLMNENYNDPPTVKEIPTMNEFTKSRGRDSVMVLRSSLGSDFPSNQDCKLAPQSTHRETVLVSTMRPGRASCFNTRISKFSFQNHHSMKDQLSQSQEKDQDEMVAVFPENRFCHAFIVQKFVQKEFYDIDIKKMFTTCSSDKSEVFEFEICCSELYRPYRVESVTKGFKQQGKLVLFPKIFQQVEKYSTPLAEVVNRLLKFHPISISRLFTNAHGISPLGQYCIWIYHKGINQFKPVFINDMIPFYQPDPEELSFAQPNKPLNPVYAPLTNENSVWFILLQKALAKVLGSYFALYETSMSDIFSMLTGCPVVNMEHITVKKLQKIFNQRIFSNKKAYVYSLKRDSPNNMRIDRVVGMEINERNRNLSVARVEEKQSTEVKMDLETMIRKYQQVCMVFYNMSFVFNQVTLPVLQCRESQVSTLITFYLINQQVEQKNELYLCLGGFSKPCIKSKITIYFQSQQHQNSSLNQLQLTDPLSYYNQKYIYQGEISKSGNYFFETEISYGKYLCMVEAEYEPGQEYFVSTYSSKPVTIHDMQHNYTEVENEVVNPLEKVIAAAKLRLKLKKERNSETAIQEDTMIAAYPAKISVNRRNSIDDLVPYDFSDYKAQKKRKFKSSFSIDSAGAISSKWIIDKHFVQDEDALKEKRQKEISGIIDQIKREQQRKQNIKLKKQLQTNEKDGILKMMSRIGESSHTEQISNIEMARSKIDRKKVAERKINWALDGDIKTAMRTR